MRGKVARTQINRVAIIIILMIMNMFFIRKKCPVKKIHESSLIIKMFAYSAMKMRANNPLLYSTLNPETNSDSPSARSNGVRLVSARLVIIHMIKIGTINRLTYL